MDRYNNIISHHPSFIKGVIFKSQPDFWTTLSSFYDQYYINVLKLASPVYSLHSSLPAGLYCCSILTVDFISYRLMLLCKKHNHGWWRLAKVERSVYWWGMLTSVQDIFFVSNETFGVKLVGVIIPNKSSIHRIAKHLKKQVLQGVENISEGGFY